MQLRPLIRTASLCSLFSMVAACASAPPPVKSAQGYYQDAEAAYAAKKYEDAIASWKKVKETYSNNELTTQAELKIADAHFENKAYIEAAAAYEDFRKLHPANPKSMYALYRLCLSHYYQITGIDTDQTPVKNAVTTMTGFLNLYPSSEYAPEVREKLADCRVKQLEYENYVGNFYLRTGKYPSAIKRLNEALLRFPNLSKLDDTLFLLGKAYLEAGDTALGRGALERVLKEYPNTGHKQEALQLLQEHPAQAARKG
jgi:outer membrane protein assembly factor BamD